ncbi:DUF5402 family protein [Methanopyrus kandleri]
MSRKLLRRCAAQLKRVQDALGDDAVVSEVDLFVARCGCVGVVFMVRGVELRDISDEVLDGLEEAGKALGVRPDVVYARVVPGTQVVIDLAVRTLCDTCRREFSGEEPRPDLKVLRGATER